MEQNNGENVSQQLEKVAESLDKIAESLEQEKTAQEESRPKDFSFGKVGSEAKDGDPLTSFILS